MLGKLSIMILVGALTLACSKEEPKQAAVHPGEAIFKKNCKVCHAQGISGAPILGNHAMWSKRAPKGEEQLVTNAISGTGLMPPKGGNSELPDGDVKLAVQYMLSQLKK